MSVVVAPTEPRVFDRLGQRRLLPERFGVDFWWFANGQHWGVQRKEVKDLIASVDDGRLSKELGQINRLDHAVLIVEGTVRWTADGDMIGEGWGRPWTYRQWLGMLAGVMARGVWVWQTSGTHETIAAIAALEAWSRKTKHQSLLKREALSSAWGRASNREFGIYMLTGLPGIGPEIASRVWEAAGKTIPWEWTMTEEELVAVDGVGTKRARGMLRALQTNGEGWK